MAERRSAIVKLPCSVFHSASDAPISTNAVVAPFPADQDGWEPVELASVLTDDSVQKTPLYGAREDARCIQVVIWKRTGSRDLQVWIDGALADPVEDSGRELVFELPAFSEVYECTLDNGETVSTVNPVSVSMFVERDTRPPEHLQVRTQQILVIASEGGEEDAIEAQRDEQSEGMMLLSSSTERPKAAAVVAPYPARTVREPFFVINDVRERRKQNLRKLQPLLAWLTASLAAYLLGGGVALLFAGTLSGTAVAQFLRGLATGSLQFSLSTLLFNRIGGGLSAALREIATDPSRIPTRLVGLVSGVFDKILRTAPLTPVRRVEFTLGQLSQSLKRIRSGNASDDQTAVLIDWLVENGQQNRNQQTFYQFLERVKATVDSVGRRFEFSPFPRSGPLDASGFNPARLAENHAEQRIVVVVSDSHACSTAPIRLVFKSAAACGLRAGLSQSSVLKDYAAALKAVSDFESATQSDDYDTNFMKSAFLLQSGLVKKVATALGVKERIERYARDIASIGKVVKEDLYEGVKSLELQTLGSRELRDMFVYILSREGFKVSKIPTNALVRRLPQHVKVEYIVSSLVVAPVLSGEFSVGLVNEIDADANASDGSKTTFVGRLTPVTRNAKTTAERVRNAIRELETLLEHGDHKIQVAQNYQSDKGLVVWKSTLATGDIATQKAVHALFVKAKMHSTALPMATVFPVDVVDKLVDEHVTRGGERRLRSELASRGGESSVFAKLVDGPASPLQATAAVAAVTAWSDLVVDAQLDRSSMTAANAVMTSAVSIIDVRAEEVLSLASLFVDRTNDSKQPPFRSPHDDDLIFFAFPGGVDLFRFLSRLHLVRQRRALASGTTPTPLALACREFVSADTLRRIDATAIGELLRFPLSLSQHARAGLEALKRVRASKDALRLALPTMPAFVMSEALTKPLLVRQSEALAAIEAVVSFVQGSNQGNRYEIVRDLTLAIVQARAALMLPSGLQLSADSVALDAAAGARRSRNIDVVPLGTYSSVADVKKALQERLRVHMTEFPEDLLQPLPFELTLLVPFAAGDNKLRTLRFPQPTMLQFDTTPVHTNALKYVLDNMDPFALLADSSSLKQRDLIGRVVDRSPVLKDQNVSATNPLAVNVSKDKVSTRPTIASVVMSQLFFEVPTTSLPTAARWSSTDPSVLLNAVLSSPGESARALDVASEVAWNAERIVQATLALLAVEKTSPMPTVLVEQPVGWVLALDERRRRLELSSTAEDDVRLHAQFGRMRVEDLYNSLWREVVLMRTGDGVPEPAAQAVDPVADAGDGQPAGGDGAAQGTDALVANLSALQIDGALSTGAGAGDGQPNTAPSLGRRANIERKPAALADDIVSDQLVRSVFDAFQNQDVRVRRELQDRLINQFLGYLSPARVASDNGDAVDGGGFADNAAAQYFSPASGAEASQRAQERLQTAFQAAADYIDVWIERDRELRAIQADEIEALNRWTGETIQKSRETNDAASWRFCIAVLIAQALLVQTLGGEAAPLLQARPARKSGPADLRLPPNLPDVALALRELVTNSIVQCEKDSIRWLTIGELTRILVQFAYTPSTNAVGEDDDDDFTLDFGDDEEEEGSGGDDTGVEDDFDLDEWRIVHADSPETTLRTVEFQYPVLRSLTSNRPLQVIEPEQLVEQRRFPIVLAPSAAAKEPAAGLGALVAFQSSVGARAPLLALGFRQSDVLAARAGAFLKTAWSRGTIRAARAFEPGLSFIDRLGLPWVQASMGETVRVADVLSALLVSDYAESARNRRARLQIPFVASRMIADGSFSAIQSAVLEAQAGNEEEIVQRCNAFDDQPVLKAVCSKLRLMGYEEQDPQALVPRLSPTQAEEASGELEFDLQDFADIEATEAELLREIDTMFSLTDGVWEVRDGRRRARVLPALDDRDAVAQARGFLSLSTARTALLTGIAVFTILSLFLFLFNGTPAETTMAAEDALGEVGNSTAELAEVQRTITERVAILTNTIWVRLTGSQPESEVDPEAFLARFRFVVTSIVSGGKEERPQLDTVEAIEYGSGGGDPNVVAADESVMGWTAMGAANALLTFAELLLLAPTERPGRPLV